MSSRVSVHRPRALACHSRYLGYTENSCHVHDGPRRTCDERVVPLALHVQLELVHVCLPVDLRICKYMSRQSRGNWKHLLTRHEADDELSEEGITEHDQRSKSDEVLRIDEQTERKEP